MLYTGSQFPFESSLRSVYWSTSRFMELRLGICATIVRWRIRPLRVYDFDRRINVRRMKTQFGDRAFSAAGIRCWNRLPAVLRAANSIDSFKTGLKTYLFSNAYSAVSWLWGALVAAWLCYGASYKLLLLLLLFTISVFCFAKNIMIIQIPKLKDI